MLPIPLYRLMGKWKLFKKAKDCELVGGEHEWYNIDGMTSGCYHCLVTSSRGGGSGWRKLP
jgi:hypothetical protein